MNDQLSSLVVPERAAFEAWAIREGWGGNDLEMALPGEYRNEWVQATWRVWQLRLTTTATR